MVAQYTSYHDTNADNPKNSVHELIDGDCLRFVEMQKVSENHPNQPADDSDVRRVDESSKSRATVGMKKIS